MKKYITIITSLTLALFWFNITYSSQDNSFTQNTQNNIKSAYLMEKYTKNLILNLVTFQDTYNLENDKDIQNIIYKLDNVTNNLKKIQSTNLDKQKAETAMNILLEQLKSINNEIKSILKQKKDIIKKDVEKEKTKYSSLTIRLSTKMDKIIYELAKKIKSSDWLNNNELQIVKNIKILEAENKKLKDFGNSDFLTKEEIRSAVISILINIKSEIKLIKSLFK